MGVVLPTRSELNLTRRRELSQRDRLLFYMTMILLSAAVLYNKKGDFYNGKQKV